MLRHLRLLVLGTIVTGLVVSGGPLSGQSAPVADEFANLHFRSIGPATMSGRIADFAVYEANPAIYYVGSAHGGVWKTTSNGAMFEAQFQDQGLISIGALAVSQKTPDLVWAGTGESNNRQSTSWGDGIYKSVDGGKSWKKMGLPESKHIGRILIDPDDNNVVFAAAAGPLFGPGGDRGVFKTTDGGATWKNVLKVDADTGANDVAMSFTDHRTLYASTYQRRRVQCCMNGGGTGSGIWKSTDGGETWTRLTNGLPPGQLGRIAVSVYRRSANIVYATIEAEGAGGGGRGAGGGPPAAAAAGGGAAGAAGAAGAGAGGGRAGGGRAGGGRAGGGGGRAGGGAAAADPNAAANAEQGAAPAAAGQSGLYRSDDGGQSWRRVNINNPRPMYFSQVRIDGNNPDRVYMGGVGLHMTNDGGQNMATDAAFMIHDDIHAIWVDPNNENHVMIGGDGGVAVTYDMSHTWVQLPNLPLALFYHVGYDQAIPFNVCGGLQDNYDWCGPSATRSSYGIRNSDWFQVQGGDGFVSIIDQRDKNIVYSESQDGNITRKNIVTGESRNIRPGPQNVVPQLPENSAPFRFNWDTPMIFSPHDPGVLLVGGNKLFMSTDKGDSWTVMSSDLTTNADRRETETMGLKWADIRISRDDGIRDWPTIVSIAESPKLKGLYYTGSDDGVVAMSKDGGKTWDNKVADRLPGFPKGAWVSEVVPSKYDANVVYVTVDAHRINDYGTYIWASTDMGATFKSLNSNLRGEAVKTLTEDPKNPDVLYVGTETGLFLSIDRGKSWRRLKANLPTVRVDEITIHPRDNAMLLATHGRAVWILDHLEPIQEYAAAQAAATAKLMSPPMAVQMRPKDDQNDEFWGHQTFMGENPPNGEAVITFFMKREGKDVHLKITDAAGKELRDLNAGTRAAGFQVVCWDMRVQPLGTQAAIGQGRGGGGGGGGRGGPGGGPGGGLTGIPMPAPPVGYMPANPCGGGGGGGFGGGGGGGNGGPLVLPATYNVNLVVDGKSIESRPLRVYGDPGLQWNDAAQKKYYDTVMDLHEMQRRGTEVTNALGPFYTQMEEAEKKIKGMANVPDSLKTQFETVKKELDTVGAKFGVPAPAVSAGGGGFGGGGGGGRGGGPPANDNDLVAKAGSVKGQMMAFQETPSDSVMKKYLDVKTALPKAITDANALLVKAMTLSQALKKYDVALTVPSPIK